MYTDAGEGIEFFGTFVPPRDITEGYDSVLEFADRKTREITINFPLYSGVTQLHIGLQQDAAVMPAAPYSKMSIMAVPSPRQAVPLGRVNTVQAF